MRDMKRHILTTTILSATLLLAAARHAMATDFNVSSASGTKVTLAASDTLTVTTAGVLTVTGNNIAVTVTGNSTITNLGTIQQTTVNTGSNAGNGRVIRDNTGGLTLTVNNGSATNSTALMQTVDGDVIQMNKAGSTITFNNYGTLNSQNTGTPPGGNQAVDWAALNTAVGSNTLNNFSTGVITANEADAVRAGVNGVVNNAGIIRATSSVNGSKDGISVQTNTGVSITNASNWNLGTPATPGTGTIEGARHGITGGLTLTNTVSTPFTTSVTNNLGGIIRGNNGSGINLDGLGALHTATIVNGGTITGNGVTGDGDGVDVDGLVNITNTGTIRSVNAFSATVVANSEGITVGGGTIVNSGTIEGLVTAGNTNAVGKGISLLGNDITTGPLAGTREAIYGNAVITNQNGGLIRGDSDSGIVVGGPASGFTVTINNNAGATIRGGATLAGLGGTNAAILTGADNDTINTAGTIDGSSNGRAIAMGGGNNTLNITGGTITGSIDGGTGGTNALTVNPGAGNAFSYGGAITNFNTTAVQGGRFNLSGSINSTSAITISSGGIFNYTGAGALGNSITVNGGEFKNNGGNFTGALTLTSGTVSGTNLSGVALSIGAGVTLSPGNSPGTMATGSQTWAGGGSYLWEINRLATDGGAQGADPGWDFADITGTLTITANAGNKFHINLDSLGLLSSWDGGHYYSFNLATASGGIFGFDASDFLIDTSAFADQHYIGAGFFSVSQHGNSLELDFTPVPEPATIGIGIALMGVAFIRRRRGA